MKIYESKNIYDVLELLSLGKFTEAPKTILELHYFIQGFFMAQNQRTHYESIEDKNKIFTEFIFYVSSKYNIESPHLRDFPLKIYSKQNLPDCKDLVFCFFEDLFFFRNK